MISKEYPIEFHINAFGELAEELQSCTRKVTISFIDRHYRAVKNNAKTLSLIDIAMSELVGLAASLADIAHNHGLNIDTCAEKMELQHLDIGRARCIDDRLLAKLLGCPLSMGKDRSQRSECGCAASIDIGMYNTCLNGCRYCYGNYNQKAVAGNFAKHNPMSPLISGEVGNDDQIRERRVKTCRETQLSLADL